MDSLNRRLSCVSSYSPPAVGVRGKPQPSPRLGRTFASARYLYTPRQPWESVGSLNRHLGWVSLYSPPAVGVRGQGIFILPASRESPWTHTASPTPGVLGRRFGECIP